MPDFETFERRILEHRDQTELIRQLGCTILVQPAGDRAAPRVGICHFDAKRGLPKASVTHDYRVEVSRRIREEFENGRHYYALHGQSLAVLPRQEGSRPAPEFLEWHHRIFKG